MNVEALKWTAFVCYLEWALIHLLAGVMVSVSAYKNDVAKAYSGVYGGADKSLHDAYTSHRWPRYANRLILQHGMNLFWLGLISLVVCIFLFYPFRQMWLLGLIPVLGDICYFVAIDLPKLGGPPGEAQTFIVSTGSMCLAYFVRETYGVEDWELILTVGISIAFLVSAALLQLKHLVSGTPKPSHESAELRDTSNNARRNK